MKIIFPKKKSGFTLEEWYELIGGSPVDMVPLPGGRELVVHDEGKLMGLAKNERATKIWKHVYPIEFYPHNNDELIVGNVLIGGRNLEDLMKI